MAEPFAAAGTNEPMPHPFFESTQFPWYRPEAVELYRALYGAVVDPRRIDFFYQQAGAGLPPLPMTLAADLVWKDALEALARASRLRRFCDMLLGESSLSGIHQRVRKAVEASGSRADSVAIVRTGLRALSDLLGEPDVKVALGVFRAVFENADRRIRRVSTYKDLHDRLHDLQVRCYAPIASASRQFPAAGTKAQLQLDAITLRGELRKIREVATRDILVEEDLAWIDEIDAAAQVLEQGLAQTDAAKVQQSARQLRQVVHTQPTWIDRLLLQGAQDLDLPQLVIKLQEVAQRLQQLGADDQQRRWVESAGDELARVDSALSHVRQSHREWQRVENALHLLEVTLGQPWEEVQSAWQTVHARLAKLWATGEPWSEQLQQSGQLLQQAIEAGNASDTIVFFSGLRTFETDRFYQVDKELKQLCDQITPIGRDLDRVVERLG